MTGTIRTHGLRKVYAAAPTGRRGAPIGPGAGRGNATPRPSVADGEVVALHGLDLEVAEGEFFGLLGPNGAGKSTTIGILTTRVRPTAGSATVAGASVTDDAVAVRQRIGVVPQRPNPDRSLDVLDNLVFHAAYFGVAKGEAIARAHRLLTQLGIADKSSRKVDELSGGQQQRLMIARALIHEPRVLFLDEPTVGLDPQARLDLWELLRELHAGGRTIVMTTHYMEEADRLCERIAIIDHGRLLALDTPQALKAQAPGGTLVELTLSADAAPAAEPARAIPGMLRVESRGDVLRAYSARGAMAIPALLEAADAAGLEVRDIHLAPPSLETLFVAMTGRKLD